MLNLVIFGGPGSGKGTQSKKIKDNYGLFHISTGEVLRDHIARDTEIGRTANQYISKGQLIPDDLMISIVEDLLDSRPEETANGVIFDGFPRTIAQAEALDKALKARGRDIDAVVGLEVDDDELVNRMLLRGRQTGRADDNEDTIKNRLSVYHQQTSPLKDFYIADGRYHRIDGAKGIDEIFSQISDKLDNIKHD
ncbi:MAG: adenylate kinase [Muribaculaceae bacterium]|nr:adenylate kinase [Muribaculaceae bacterium]